MSVYKKIGIASLIMMVSIFLSRFTGLFREMAIAYIGGTDKTVDAYQIAFILPEILNHIVASGFLSITFIPIFSRYLTNNNAAEGWRIFSLILTTFGVFLIFLIIVASIFTPTLIALFAPGLHDPETMNAAIYMTRIILPAQFFFFCGGLFMAVQFTKEKFTIPALAPLLYNIGIICGGMIWGKSLGMTGFAWGALIGAFIGNFSLQLWGAYRAGMHYTPIFNFSHPDLLRYIMLTLPLMLGLTMTFSTEIFIKFFGTFLSQGSIASLNYGLRVMLMLVAFFGQAVGVASFPFLSRLAAENKMEQLNNLLNNTLRYLALVIPFSALIITLRYEIIRLLFQRGKFDTSDTLLTADILIYLMIGAFAFAAQTVVARGFYAVQNTVTPAIIGTITVLLSIPFYFIGMQKMNAPGIAMAVSISAILQVGTTYQIWNKKTGNSESKHVYAYYLKMILISIPLYGFLRYFHIAITNVINPFRNVDSIIIIGIISIVFILLLISLGYIFNIHEIKMIHARARAKITPKS